jgi:hypothetical protein
MATPAAKVRQADLARVMREAKKHGAKRVHVDVGGGTIDIFLTDDQMEMLPNQQPPRAMFRTRPVPKKKVVL